MDSTKYNKYQKYNKQAVALSYDADKDIAPKIVANGKGLVAEEIVRLAEENGIPIRNDKDLIKILSLMEIDAIIPIEAYSAVAEILKSIYKINAENGK